VTHAHAGPAVKKLTAGLRAAAALLALAASVAAPAPARATPAGDVVVICDREIAPYRALLDALASACDCELRVIPPEEAARDGLERRLTGSGARAVLAVGVRAREAVEGLREVPVLLAMAPQVAPWVAARPNRTGIEMALSPRQHLEAIARVFPQARRVGVIFDPAQSGDYVREAQAAAAALKLTLETREIGRPGELVQRLDGLRGRVDVLWLLPDPTVLQGENLDALLLESFESRVPLYAFSRKYVALGALAASQFDVPALGRQVAALLRRLPAPPASLPAPRWEYTRGAQLVLNQKVARKLGVVFPAGALEAAADVIR
jgi:putative ABC transport system substrate-binding protein